MKLRNEQIKIIDELFKDINTNTIISSPSGSGKTFMIAETIKRLLKSNNKPLIIAHTNEIREQIKKRLNDFKIKKSLPIISSVKGLNLILNDELNYKPTHIIIDEAHHSEAKTYQDFIEYFNNATVIGFTATPTRTDNKSLANIYERIIHGLSIRTLIEQNKLANFEYFAPDFGDKGINSIINSEHLELNDNIYTTGGLTETNFKATIYADIVDTYKKHIPHEQVILFSHNNKASKEYCLAFIKAGFKAKYLTDTTNKTLRKQIIKDFRNNKIEILINCNIISEGFDVPDVNNVILARPTNSVILYLQQASRALRYRPDKKAKIFDHVNNVKRLGSVDLDRHWSLSLDDIKARSVGETGNENKESNKVEYKYLKEFKLTKYTDTNTFNEEVDAALSLIKDSDKFEDNNPARIALINIQNKYQIVNINAKNTMSWSGSMFKKYNLI